MTTPWLKNKETYNSTKQKTKDEAWRNANPTKTGGDIRCSLRKGEQILGTELNRILCIKN